MQGQLADSRQRRSSCPLVDRIRQIRRKWVGGCAPSGGLVAMEVVGHELGLAVGVGNGLNAASAWVIGGIVGVARAMTRGVLFSVIRPVSGL